ncbi:MAG: hypothetical protein ACLQVF_31945, partial [Isosphaeraceae bacterium]
KRRPESGSIHRDGQCLWERPAWAKLGVNQANNGVAVRARTMADTARTWEAGIGSMPLDKDVLS